MYLYGNEGVGGKRPGALPGRDRTAYLITEKGKERTTKKRGTLDAAGFLEHQSEIRGEEKVNAGEGEKG